VKCMIGRHRQSETRKKMQLPGQIARAENLNFYPDLSNKWPHNLLHTLLHCSVHNSQQKLTAHSSLHSKDAVSPLHSPSHHETANR